MRMFPLFAVLPLVAASASARVDAPIDPLRATVAAAEKEQRSAEAEAGRLERIAAKADDEASRTRASLAAIGQQMAAAEARITAAEARLQQISAFLASRRAKMAQDQRPVAALLTGLAVMADRPPLLALAGGGDTDDLVEVRILLDSTIPAVRAKTAALSAQLRQGERLAQAAALTRSELQAARRDLAERQQRFAALERSADRLAARTGRAALGAGDIALRSAEDAEGLRAAAANRALSASIAALLAADEPAPPGPRPSAPTRPPLAYRMPAAGAVTAGVGEVDENGIRARGVTLATPRGAAIVAPAAGVVRFAGPFREHDGVVILDHGNGWVTLLLNVATELKPGQRIALGAQLGRALGPIGVELSQNGKYRSPALIAGSSGALSKVREGS